MYTVVFVQEISGKATKALSEDQEFAEEEFMKGNEVGPFNRVHFEWKKQQKYHDIEFKALAERMGSSWTPVIQLDDSH